MKIVKTIKEARACIRAWRMEGDSIGFVPTMGYLHEGHGSLVKRSVRENKKTVVSIFVNPMQFGANEDLESYPRDLEKDAAYCESLGADLIFHPEPAEMYPDGFCTYVDMPGLTEELCGLSRPGHFRGVCTVVAKLFHIVAPDRAYFGQKDAQQLAVITRMAKDLDMDVEVIGCPIVREADGLAKSSRNTYLNRKEREAALVLSRAVRLGQTLVHGGETDAGKIIREMAKLVEEEPLAKIDYIKAVDALTMQQVDTLASPMLVAMAVYIGRTRLIDNFSI